MDAWVWIVIAVVVVVIVAAVVASLVSSRRRRELQGRFGPEYDRTVESADSRRDAERELRDRAARHDELELRPLSDAERERYSSRWNDVQAGFVDRPTVAVADADDLVTQLMRDRGYPVDDFETRSDLVSVDHPDVVTNYRRGHEIYQRTVSGDASTEDLRVAVVSYRSLYEELMRDGDVREDAGRR